MKMTRSVLNQIISAAVMAMLGTGISMGSELYRSAYDMPAADPVRETAAMVESTEFYPETETKEESSEETAETVAVEETEQFVPSLTTLNLAFYNDDAAGKILRELSFKESAWLSAIYGLACGTPKEAAARIGKAVSSVTGRGSQVGENENGENQSVENEFLPGRPIQEWSSIEMVFLDEDGNRISADSNMKEIMAMANTYFYYIGPEDQEGFLDYVLELWDKSHKYSYSVSDVYYCDESCITELAEMDKEQASPSSASEGAAESENVYGQDSGQTQEIGPGIGLLEKTGTVESPLSAVEQEVLQTGVSAEENSAALQGQKTELAGQAAKSLPERLGEMAGTGEIQMDAKETSQSEASAQDASSQCPGHVDLHITAVISGLSASKNSLFALDTYADRYLKERSAVPDESAAPAPKQSATEQSVTEQSATEQSIPEWPGWTDENREAAVELAKQDWKAAYNLTVPASYISNPLSAEEIGAYMRLLPEDMGQERRELIHYALASVGKVPYYWGGKPSAPDYEGNYFGTLAAPDEDGRTMSGLDCSGWISWVYWSSIDYRLPYESTGGLANCGTGVQRDELKPGDIVLRLGNNAHVVMFLAWEPDGRMKVIHESSGIINNVTVSAMSADWPYYRKLID